MNGIGGVVVRDTGINSMQVCDNMQTALKSRGADLYGTYISAEMCLIHMGSNKSHVSKQPVRATMGQKAYILVFDGELYNAEELRQELSKLGYRFSDANDAAVVLHSYMAWGQNCVEQFNGVFAFAIWDEAGLFIARDRLGLRPLFYATGDFGFVFASTIKGVLSHPSVPAEIGDEGVAELVLMGPGRSPGFALFTHVRELAPGECAYYKDGLSLHTYWRLKAKHHEDSFSQTVETVRGLFADSVRRHVAKSGSIVSLLSGGLDSSAITAISRIKDSFSVDYVGNEKYFFANSQKDEDREYVEIMTAARGLNHRRIVLGSDELADSLTDAMNARGFPGMADIDGALLLLLHRVAAAGFDTAFSGEGADEIFGGYPWYQDEELLFADTFPWAREVEYRASFLAPGFLPSPKEFLQNRFNRAISAANTLYDDDKTEKRARQMYNLNLGWFMQTLASRSDCMATAAGIRLRTPFLDYRLVEYLFNVPWAMKNHDEREKGLLREVVKNNLPDKILQRRKTPFPKIYTPGYTKRVQDMLKNLLHDKNALIYQIVKRESLEGLLAENDKKWYGQLMTYPQTVAYFLQLNAWMSAYNVKVTKI